MVQIRSEPIKNTISTIREQLRFLGKPSVTQKTNNNTLIYRYESEIPPVINLRLKIEINCREHFTVIGYQRIKHLIENTWANGSCDLITFRAEEMLGTKLRALYQRKKGRDLFDLYYALSNLDLDTELTVKCYKKYISFAVDKPPTRKQFILNIEEKLFDPDFTGDIYGLLRPGVDYDQDKAYHIIKTELIEKI